ncbi:hypothetical protein T439DRAFT_300502 [Meredithblackwellia eburnea MCA 4105]
MSALESGKTVYVGGFSSETNSQVIHSAFAPFGDIQDIQLPSDPQNSKSHRGFAFVSFTSSESATDAIDNMHRNVLPGPSNVGRSLKVNLAKPQKNTPKGGNNRAVWADEEWLKEHGNAPVGAPTLGGAIDREEE